MLVFDAAGSLYVTRRSARKDVYPGLLDVVTSGVVSAGESYAETAARELREELGFAGAAPEQLFTFRWVDASCRVWCAVFRARSEGAVRHADGEVASGEWLPMREVVYDGARRRLRPVVMTAAIAALGLVPLLFATGPGSEIQKPLAIVVIGGLISSTVLTLFLLPILFQRFGVARVKEDRA